MFGLMSSEISTHNQLVPRQNIMALKIWQRKAVHFVATRKQKDKKETERGRGQGLSHSALSTALVYT